MEKDCGCTMIVSEYESGGEISKYSLTKQRNTKTGDDIWVVKVVDRLDRDEYKTIESKVKSNGGYYSTFVHGFVFKKEPSTEMLNGVFGGTGGAANGSATGIIKAIDLDKMKKGEKIRKDKFVAEIRAGKMEAAHYKVFDPYQDLDNYLKEDEYKWLPAQELVNEQELGRISRIGNTHWVYSITNEGDGTIDYGSMKFRYNQNSEIKKIEPVEKDFTAPIVISAEPADHRVFVVRKDGSKGEYHDKITKEQAEVLYEKYIQDNASEIVTWDRQERNQYGHISALVPVKMKIMKEAQPEQQFKQGDRVALLLDDNIKAVVESVFHSLGKIKNIIIKYEGTNDTENVTPADIKLIEEEKLPAGAYYYTTAPDSYFGFGTKVISNTEYLDSKEKEVRKVFIPKDALVWQRNRNLSGNYGTFTEEEYEEYLKLNVFKKKDAFEKDKADRLFAEVTEKYKYASIEFGKDEKGKDFAKIKGVKYKQGITDVIIKYTSHSIGIKYGRKESFENLHLNKDKDNVGLSGYELPVNMSAALFTFKELYNRSVEGKKWLEARIFAIPIMKIEGWLGINDFESQFDNKYEATRGYEDGIEDILMEKNIRENVDYIDKRNNDGFVSFYFKNKDHISVASDAEVISKAKKQKSGEDDNLNYPALNISDDAPDILKLLVKNYNSFKPSDRRMFGGRAYLSYAGDHNKNLRIQLLKALTGNDYPAYKAGIGVVETELNSWLKKQTERTKAFLELKAEPKEVVVQQENPRSKAVGLISGGSVSQIEKKGYEFVSGELKKGGGMYYEIVGIAGGGAAMALLGQGVTIALKEKKSEPIPVTAEQIKSEKTYTYILSNARGFSIGTYPKEGFVEYLEDFEGTAYGAIVYNKKLSFDDMRRYDFKPFTQAQELIGKSFEKPFGNGKMQITIIGMEIMNKRFVVMTVDYLVIKEDESPAKKTTKEGIVDLLDRIDSGEFTPLEKIKPVVLRDQFFYEGDKAIFNGKEVEIESVGVWKEDKNAYRMLWSDGGLGYDTELKPIPTVEPKVVQDTNLKEKVSLLVNNSSIAVNKKKPTIDKIMVILEKRTDDKDIDKIIGWFSDTINPTSRQILGDLIGQKLPKTQKGTDEFLRDYIGIDKKEKFFLSKKEAVDLINQNIGKELFVNFTKRDFIKFGHKGYSRNPSLMKIIAIEGNDVVYSYLDNIGAEYVKNIDNVRDIVIGGVSSIGDKKMEEILKPLYQLEKEAQSDKVEPVADNQHSFDLTHFGNSYDFLSILAKNEIDQNHKGRGLMGTNEAYLWEGNDIRIVTSSNPKTNDGYAGYIGIEGNKNRVMNLVKQIRKYDPKDEEKGLGFINFNYDFHAFDEPLPTDEPSTEEVQSVIDGIESLIDIMDEESKAEAEVVLETLKSLL
jgi:hypothetical protein